MDIRMSSLDGTPCLTAVGLCGGEGSNAHQAGWGEGMVVAATTAQRERKAQLSVERSGCGSTYLFHLFTHPFTHHCRGHRWLLGRVAVRVAGAPDLTDGTGARSSVLNFSYLV